MEKNVSAFCEQVSKKLGPNLRSIILYGSALRGDFVRGRSNFNLLIITERMDFETLKHLAPIVRRGIGKRRISPIFFTAAQIESSLDVFPIEFLELRENYKLLQGEDLFKNLEVPLMNLRLQCELELKSKLIQLRKAYLEVGGNKCALREILIRALSSVRTLFKAIERLRITEEISDDPVFLALSRLKKREEKPNDIEGLFAKYLTKIEGLVERIDAL